ncbi:MAG: Bacterial alpha-L-rhamnosidase [Chitinivibrionales bacterium]|nr:Bacterial alpha-L-rhamnosidase [Chitinivibrionales bacterium]
MSETRPFDLRSEYAENPLGIETCTPRLSWRIPLEPKGNFQCAYQILVASTANLLEQDTGDLWDSGKVESDNSVHIEYSGAPLHSRMRCFWKVRFWDANGTPSDFSEPATWEMGLLDRDDWSAHWIGLPYPIDGYEAPCYGYCSEFTIDPEEEKWITIDLGTSRQFSSIRLFPATCYEWLGKEGFLFPLKLKIDISNTENFTEHTTIVDKTSEDIPNPGKTPKEYHFDPCTARYIRIRAKLLGRWEANIHGFALTEVEIYGGDENIALGKKVTASDSCSCKGWSPLYCTNGVTESKKGNPGSPAPATVLKKTFPIEKQLAAARLYTTCLGVYEMHINGTRVGEHILAPEWTDYGKRVQYQTYDITPLLRRKENLIVATCGEGWYAGRLGLTPGRRFYGNRPQFMAQLEIEYSDGTRGVVHTDSSWQGTLDGPIRSSCIFDGEVYDAPQEIDFHQQSPVHPGPYREQGTKNAKDNKQAAGTPQWNNAEIDDSITVPLVSQFNEPIKITRELSPISITEPKSGVYVADMGQNMVGWCRINVSGKPGDTITLRHAEVVDKNGMVAMANLRTAAQTDTFILGGKGPETLQPHFTYHGFRYVEITGLSSKPGPDFITGCAFHSAAPETGTFECSEPLLNKLMTAIQWTQRDNMHSTPTDCPQRDERLGWGGDASVFSQTACFNMNMARFYTKWAGDCRDAQTDDGRFSDFSPNHLISYKRFSGAPGWADGSHITPWRVYENYGDRRIIREHYESSKKWIEFIRSHNPDLIWRNCRGVDYGDWLSSQTYKPENYPWQKLGTPKQVFATAFFAHGAEILAKMAQAVGHDEDAGTYSRLATDIKAAFCREFLDNEGKIEGHNQTVYTLALHFDLVPHEMRSTIISHLVERVQYYNFHPSTGLQPTHRMMIELAKANQTDLAYKLLMNRDIPSWGHMIDQGATTIWERWDGIFADGTINPHEMNSFNHFAFGAIGEWIYRVILGINPDPDTPGYKSVIIHPRPGGGLTWAKGRYESIYGELAVSWEIKDGRFDLDVTVPGNVWAKVVLPGVEENKIAKVGSGEHAFSVKL